MTQIYVIALDSIRGLLRQRLLLGIIIASLGLTILSSAALGKMHKSIAAVSDEEEGTTSGEGSNTLSDEDRRQLAASMEMASTLIQAGFYGAALFGGTIVALLVFSTAVSTEIRTGTIRVTLSKPVSRTQYILGKYLGGLVVLLGYAIVASIAMLAFARSQGLDLSPALRYAPWLMLCRQLMLGSAAMLLSLFVRPVIASVLAFFVSDTFLAPPNPLYYVLPSYSRFNAIPHVLSGSLIDPHELLLLTLYGLDLVAICLLLALWRFRHQELI